MISTVMCFSCWTCPSLCYYLKTTTSLTSLIMLRSIPQLPEEVTHLGWEVLSDEGAQKVVGKVCLAPAPLQGPTFPEPASQLQSSLESPKPLPFFCMPILKPGFPPDVPLRRRNLVTV